MIRSLLVAAVALVCVTSSAEASPRQKVDCTGFFSFLKSECGNPAPKARQAGEVTNHPSGCPHIAFCGCGASVRVFGHSIRKLWLAANWFHFPRSSPAPGMVAVRRHHVFVLENDLGRGIWQVYDANSGGHMTRIHPRSLAGFTIVNPHG